MEEEKKGCINNGTGMRRSRKLVNTRTSESTNILCHKNILVDGDGVEDDRSFGGR